MTTNTMTCERFGGLLMDWLERDTDEATRVAMERHAASCAICGPLAADLRTLEREAAGLPGLAPSRDLWAGIAERIATPVVAIGAPRVAPGRRQLRRLGRAGLLAASLVGAVALGYLVRGSGAVPGPVAVTSPVRPGAPDSLSVATPAPSSVVAQTPDAPEAPVGGPASSSSPAPARGATGAAVTSPATTATPSAIPRRPSVQLAAATITADYDREIAALRRVLQERRVPLDSTTLAVIERNLAVIDSAIADSRRAIASDPSSPYLIELLNQSLQTKVELMRTAALLPSRT